MRSAPFVAVSLACAAALACRHTEPGKPTVYAPGAPSSGEERTTAAPMAASPAPPPSVPAPETPEPPVQTASPETTVPATAERGDVYLNGSKLAEPDLRELEARLGQRPESGKYWYDAKSGLWGLSGHGASGLTLVRLRAEPLALDASSGSSGVVVDGRALTAGEVTALATLLAWPANELPHYAGNYTLDQRSGFYGPGNRYLGNLAALATKAAAPKSARCVWLHLNQARAALGRDALVECD